MNPIPQLEKHLQKFNYSLHLYWHEDRQEWEAVLCDDQSIAVASSFDAVLTTAVGVAMLKAMQPAPPD